MKRVQNWRDYLDDPDPKWKQKFTKKKREEGDQEEFDKRTEKKRSKRK